MNFFFVDCEAPRTAAAPSTGTMTEFGAVHFIPEPPYVDAIFHGPDAQRLTFEGFAVWLNRFNHLGRPIFWSDNPAYDWQWINYYFHQHLGFNPFGHSARRIGDFYAGLTGQVRNHTRWKRLRLTPHDHHPAHDAQGNAEAFGRLLKGER